MITRHYFVGRVEAVAKPDFLECPVWFRSSTRPTGHYDNLSIRNGISISIRMHHDSKTQAIAVAADLHPDRPILAYCNS